MLAGLIGSHKQAALAVPLLAAFTLATSTKETAAVPAPIPYRSSFQ